jgi:hypothetical protein
MFGHKSSAGKQSTAGAKKVTPGGSHKFLIFMMAKQYKKERECLLKMDSYSEVLLKNTIGHF